MLYYKWAKRIAVVIVLGIFIPGLQSSAQQSPGNLYQQTSEMADMMIQYDADKGSIMRFYSTHGSQGEWWTRRQLSDYNTPERRQHLLELINNYQKQMQLVDFSKMNINGKVDYLLFKRDLDDEEYKLQQEDKIYQQVTQYLPFSDRIYALEKPRRRGIAANGEEVAKELNSVCKEIIKAIDKLKAGDSIEKKQTNMVVAAVKGLQ
ncbi:MAG: hypothetical protein EPN92_05345, partial [Chitinophagaceae bacterium]